MKRYITLLLLLLGTYFSAFSQVPEFLGIRITDNLSTWKSSLIQKGFVVIPERSEDEESSTFMSSTYLQGKYNGYDCVISLLHELDGESVFSFVANVNCKNIIELNKTFESILNEYLRRYSVYKVEYKDDDVTFNYDKDKNDVADMTISLCKRFEPFTVNGIEMSNVLQIVVFNIEETALRMIINAYKNIEPPTILGIEFGSDKNTVKSALIERFGYNNVMDNNGIIEVENPTLGGFKFKYASFEFQYDKDKTYLSKANFQTFYTLGQESVANKEREFLLSLMKPKYEDTIEDYTNEDGFKCYRFGTNPRDFSKSLGLIRSQKGMGNDGVKRLYLHLSYGPINYIDPSSDF